MKKEKNDYAKNRARNKLERSLVEQLAAQKKNTVYHLDLVKDYIELYDLKEKLQSDIVEKGLRYESFNAKGQVIMKPNESVLNLIKVSSQMLKILSDLNIQAAVVIEEIDESDGYM